MGEPIRVGVIGCGVISGKYFDTLQGLAPAEISVVADRDVGRAEAVGADRGFRASSVEDLLRDPTVDVVLNLTTPDAHADVALRAIAAGKPVYNEKPLAATTWEARKILDAAADAGVMVGCAPDTVLGTGIQTARAAIDGDAIGTPVAATATFTSAGPDLWHPNPDFYFLPGGGPLLDMGPYYITSLVTMLGPVVEVVGAGARPRDERVIGKGPRQGESIPVAVDTHVTGVLVHASGVLSTLVMSFDTAASHAAPIEVHGLEGTLAIGSPNKFDAPTQLRRPGKGQEWSDVPVSAGYAGSSRGYGVVDMMTTLDDTLPRASGALGYHVLDVMESVLRSAGAKQTVTVESTCERPAPVPLTQAVVR